MQPAAANLRQRRSAARPHLRCAATARCTHSSRLGDKPAVKAHTVSVDAQDVGAASVSLQSQALQHHLTIASCSVRPATCRQARSEEHQLWRRQPEHTQQQQHWQPDCQPWCVATDCMMQTLVRNQEPARPSWSPATIGHRCHGRLSSTFADFAAGGLHVNSTSTGVNSSSSEQMPVSDLRRLWAMVSKPDFGQPADSPDEVRLGLSVP